MCTAQIEPTGDEWDNSYIVDVLGTVNGNLTPIPGTIRI